jgi:L-alanine-DL-glutamate epimerase-like enolase superfamily enzyme
MSAKPTAREETPMKITHVTTRCVRLPIEEPLVGAPPSPSMQREFVTVTIGTDDGIEGNGVTGFGGKLVRTLATAVEELGELIKGDDPIAVDAIRGKLVTASASCGPGGIATLALTAIDIALWDIRGKALGLPLARLLGGLRERVPAYASGALMRSTPLDKVQEAAAALVKKGWRRMKTQMAVDGLTPNQEIERIRLLREAVGPDVQLMVDINQRWSVEQAISVCARIEALGLGWLEDVTAANDYQGLAQIAAALATPVCGGEYLYGIEPFRQMLAHRSVDIVMIDLLRVGGIGPWMKVAGMAEAFNLPVVSHLLPEIHVHLVAAAPNATVVEYMPWTWRLFDEPPLPRDGMLTVPSKPGLGFGFAPDLFTKYGA